MLMVRHASPSVALVCCWIIDILVFGIINCYRVILRATRGMGSIPVLTGSYIGVGLGGHSSCVSDGGVEVRLELWLVE